MECPESVISGEIIEFDRNLVNNLPYMKVEVNGEICFCYAEIKTFDTQIDRGKSAGFNN